MCHYLIWLTVSTFLNVVTSVAATFCHTSPLSSTAYRSLNQLYVISTKDNKCDFENPLDFMSEEMQVYIEDTDAYSVIYNGNYIRFYERALQLSGSLPDPNWYICSVNRHKFKSSPTLGDKFRIHGERCNPSTWNLRMLESLSTTQNKDME